MGQYFAEQVLTRGKETGDTVVVIVGGLVGNETALWLAKEERQITTVEVLPILMVVNGPDVLSEQGGMFYGSKGMDL